jgi:hypothetical protein
VEDLSKHLGYKNYSDVKSLTQEEAWSVMSYGFTEETDYQDINGYLRFGDQFELYNQTVSSVTKLINDIYSAASKLPKIPSGLIVYRGFQLTWRNGECFKAGEIVSDKAFTSTTLDTKIAHHFAFEKESGNGALLTLELASDQDGILITEYDEAEVLLMPNRKITIIESHKEGNKCLAKGRLE